MVDGHGGAAAIPSKNDPGNIPPHRFLGSRMSYPQPKYFVPVLAAVVLLAPFEAAAQRRPLTPYTAKLEVSEPEFTVTTDLAGDYVISYLGEKGRPVSVVFAPPNKVRLTLAAAVTSDAKGNFNYRYEPATAAGSPPVTTIVVEYQERSSSLPLPAGEAMRSRSCPRLPGGRPAKIRGSLQEAASADSP